MEVVLRVTQPTFGAGNAHLDTTPKPLRMVCQLIPPSSVLAMAPPPMAKTSVALAAQTSRTDGIPGFWIPQPPEALLYHPPKATPTSRVAMIPSRLAESVPVG